MLVDARRQNVVVWRAALMLVDARRQNVVVWRVCLKKVSCE